MNDVLDDVESDLVAGRWRLRAPASLATPRRVRAELRRWLVALRWSEEEAADIVLAVDEAVSNAVEHAYRASDSDEEAQDRPSGADPVAGFAADDGEVRVEDLVDDLVNVEVPAEVEITVEVLSADGRQRHLRICVRDWGRWQPKPTDPGPRGRGLDLMVGLMATATLRSGDPAAGGGEVGTAVTLTTHPVDASR